MHKTTYTIKTTGLPVAAYDYQYNPDGLTVWPLCSDGLTRQPVPVTIPWEQYTGFTAHEVRVPHKTDSDRPDPEQARPEVLPQSPPHVGKLPAVRFYFDDKSFSTWEQTDSYLQECARTDPAPEGCYDKFDFQIIFEDGQDYTGRYDLRATDANYTGLLARHVRKFLEYGATQSSHSAAHKQNCQTFLDRYEIPALPETDSAPIAQTPEPEPAQ
jgi:hypothetical protein